MSVVPVADVLQGRVAVDQEVTVRGWVRTRRDSKAGISFLAVYDGSCFDPVQAVINNSLPNYNEEVLHLTTGCSVVVTGKVVASPGQGQSFEIQATKVEVAGWVEDPDTYPMAAKRHSIEYLREVAHLRPRTNLIGAVARVRHTLAQALHRFFDEQGFFWVSTPLITASDTEGAGEMFRVSTLDLENLPRNDQGRVDFDKDFFGKESFLTVSGQLNVKRMPVRCPKSILLGRPSARKIPTPAATWRSSGCWSRKWRSPIWKTTPVWRKPC